MYNQFTRISFCDKCFTYDSPRDKDECLIVTPKGAHFLYQYYNLRQYKKVSPRAKGFTPHIYTLITRYSKCIEYDVVCSICILQELGKDICSSGGYFPAGE